ncbi:MAG: helix-turn-helix domain-containing protein [Clostridia bacterium]|nr:helix-turn-helix domain-containing protein [Clostridia bacterium]
MNISEEGRAEKINRLTEELPVLRAMLRISQADLARAIGVSRQTCSLIETGKQQMTWVTFMAMVAFFGENSKTRAALVALNILENKAF